MTQITEIIIEHLMCHKDDNNFVVVGTDSQNFDYTKIVAVIAMYTEGKGGKFFYDILKISPFPSKVSLK